MSKPVKLLLVLFSMSLLGWVIANPGSLFGMSRFGVTTYNRIPIPYFDLQIRADGAIRWVTKSHDLNATTVEWLLRPAAPEVLVVALGWRSGVRPDHTLAALAGTRVLAVPTDEALPLYNSLKARGVRVAIHVHSTC